MSCETRWQDVFLTKPSYGVQNPKEMDDVFVTSVMSVDVINDPVTDSPIARITTSGSNWLMMGFIYSCTDKEKERWARVEEGDMIRVATADQGGFSDYLTVLEKVEVTNLYNTGSVDFQVVSSLATPLSYSFLNMSNALSRFVNTQNTFTNGDAVRLTVPAAAATAGVTEFTDGNTYYVVEAISTSLSLSATKGGPKVTVAVSGIFPGIDGFILHKLIPATNGVLPLAGKGAASLAIRVNFAIDATTLPSHVSKDSDFTSGTAITLADRGMATTYRGKTRTYDGTDEAEALYYPCYKQRKWTDHHNPTSSVLKLHLPTNIKQVSAVKLMGYSMINKRAISVHHQHELADDDWFALKIREVHNNNGVLSNNRFADECFYVMHAGNDQHRRAGGVELYAYDPQGLTCVNFTPVNLGSLSVEVVNRRGEEAHFGRMHLWLRILVTKG